MVAQYPVKIHGVGSSPTSSANPLKLAVYAITKNESKFVDKWLENMSPADYIVVLDTGSTDDTVEKLRASGKVHEVRKVRYHNWRFDVARNDALAMVPSDVDICVSVDLDELFTTPDWATIIKDHWVSGTNKATYLYTWNYDSEGNPLTQITYEKIHSRHGWHWAMPVHEALTPNPGTVVSSVHIPGDLLELGHYPDLSKSRSQYIDLMRLAVSENPNSYIQNYYLGRELYYHKQYEEALEQLSKTVEMPNFIRANQAAAYSFMGECYEALGHLLDAEEDFIQATTYTTNVREPYVKLIEFYYRHKNWMALIGAAHIALNIERSRTEWYENTNNYTYIIPDYLSMAYYKIGHRATALRYAQEALSHKPNDTRLQHNVDILS